MSYISTRGASPEVGFTQAVLAGLAPDGGLYVPKSWPQLSADEIRGFTGKPYAAVAARILSLFAGADLTPEAALAITEGAYATFNHPATTPLTQLDSDLWLLELYHGPTLAFKDVAMQMLARLYERALDLSGQTLTIVAATSGDTGGAAVEAFAGRRGVRLVVLFPEGRISAVQRKFMTANTAANITCLSVDGTFDDCQRLVKSLFQDVDFASEVGLSGVNSINFARILAQSVYYFVAAAAVGSPDRAPTFIVPTGNFGDAFAGFVAQAIGLPVRQIVAATNANDILARALNTGRYELGQVAATISPAMDIQVASNFERLVFETLGRDGETTRNLFAQFGQSGGFDIPPAALARMRETFIGASASDDQAAAQMRFQLQATGGLVDPHTAVGLHAARSLNLKGPRIVLSTAHPAKFPETVLERTGRTPDAPLAAQGLEQKPERYSPLKADLVELKAKIRSLLPA